MMVRPTSYYACQVRVRLFLFRDGAKEACCRALNGNRCYLKAWQATRLVPSLRIQYCTVQPFHSQQKSAKQPFECVRHVNRCTSNCCIDKSVFNLSWLVTELGVWRISCLLLRSHFMQHTVKSGNAACGLCSGGISRIEFMVICGWSQVMLSGW